MLGVVCYDAGPPYLCLDEALKCSHGHDYLKTARNLLTEGRLCVSWVTPLQDGLTCRYHFYHFSLRGWGLKAVHVFCVGFMFLFLFHHKEATHTVV